MTSFTNDQLKRINYGTAEQYTQRNRPLNNRKHMIFSRNLTRADRHLSTTAIASIITQRLHCHTNTRTQCFRQLPIISSGNVANFDGSRRHHSAHLCA